MSDADREAFELAISMMRRSGEPVWMRAVEDLLQTDGFEAAGKYSAHAMQFRSLKSAPWLTLPCNLSDSAVDAILCAGDHGHDHHGDYSAAVLRRKMQRHGISRWHPDPERA